MNMGCDFSPTKKEKEFDIRANNTWSKAFLNTLVFEVFLRVLFQQRRLNYVKQYIP